MSKKKTASGKARSPDDMRHREISWLLYCSEGYAANLRHAAAVNAYTMKRADLALLRRAIREADKIARSFREAM